MGSTHCKAVQTIIILSGAILNQIYYYYDSNMYRNATDVSEWFQGKEYISVVLLQDKQIYQRGYQ